MIIITGAAGFIGSAIAWQLNENGRDDLILVDKLKTEEKWKNIAKRDYYDWVDREELFEYLANEEIAKEIEAVIHMGACSATTEKDMDFLMKNNYEYSKKLWEFCTRYNIKYIYASSAATYGLGEQGYNDEINLEGHKKLRPLNKYGYSKKIFDIWALKQKETPKNWVGFKFFNVYGPNEYHKGRMASMVFHSYNQAKENGYVKLFKSHNKNFKDGEQLRDFVYIKDVVSIIEYFLNNNIENGVYNLGTGKERSFYDLAYNTLVNANKNPKIEFVDMPMDLRGRYQYFTKAEINKLRKIGYTKEFYTLEEGVKDYVRNYLEKDDKYL
ncbi:ADP-glyceromanno-heptose 6-epimerase precursor [Hypnocyclicus thermotrophus]|uniref:ADP-L-glycero-D-manno-heptose-6-epimerase n=1 Tax=Hypnocyclicus thermotrophus TaxID=1627895 RepID=A0AA46DXC3_9FUSO|nr:ADP-glyceromanno-heptose 6-epimerase [Hypnocyclicus thermotrophus]TDT67933.1 ADP-glyceromanno-heptose 6-epimerase precursor [Hypnocyclicus thermotrophus]